MLVKIYAGEITKTRVRANLIDPGIVRTRLRARAFPGEDPARLPPPESVTDAFLALALPECTRNGEILDVRDRTQPCKGFSPFRSIMRIGVPGRSKSRRNALTKYRR